MTPNRVAVIDVGKTNAKLALVDMSDLSEIAVVTRPNTVRTGAPYPHFDVDGIWAFLLGALAEFHKTHGIDAISVTTHGASGALIDAQGGLAAPILDYEHTGPDTVAEAYDAVRPSFEETGSPRLSLGLNLGAQIHWQFHQDPDLRARTAAIVTYPQYWGHRLTGELACDVSSLGAHTDLWNPHTRSVSTLVERLGISAQLAPARLPRETLGQIRGEVAAQTGLRVNTPVQCGIHDSNASLLPHILWRAPPFSVVSTGTWVIAMTVGGRNVTLDPTRDTLINVNANGGTVPSARFMGGREFELLQGRQSGSLGLTELGASFDQLPYLLPAIVQESGPFQGRQARWIGGEPLVGTPERAVAISFYLALMTAECLSLTGHDGSIVVEGPFAANPNYCAMLSIASGCLVVSADNATGTSQGAAMLTLTSPDLRPASEAKSVLPKDQSGFARYASAWRHAVYS